MKTMFLFFIALLSLCITARAQWEEQTSGTTNSIYTISAVDNDICWVGADGGVVLRTIDGGINWSDVGGGIIGTANIRNLFAWNADFALCSATPSATFVYRTTNGGTNWTQVFTQVGGYIANIWMTSETNGFIIGDAVGGRWSIWRTIDGGVNWDSTGLYLPQAGTEWSLPSAMYTDGTRIYFGTDNSKIYYSSDSGTNWAAQTLPLTNSWGIWFNTPSLGLACGEPEGMVVTTNGGITWFPMTIPAGTGNVYSVIGYGDQWYYIQGTNIIGSTDNGGSWTTVHTAPAGSYYIFCKARNGDAAWAGRANGGITKGTNINLPVEFTSFIASVNVGEITLNWSTATELNNQGFEVQRKIGSNEFVTIGSVRGQGTTTSPNNYTYVDKLSDTGKYFYRLKQVDFSGTFEYSKTIEVEVSPVFVFSLEQNFPNPFNPNTTINYSVPSKLKSASGGESSNLNLKVFDILGNELVTLVNEEKPAGNYEIDFNAANLPSGVYIYQLRVAEFVQTRKMVLMK